jgi:hypothetical protein
MEVPELASLKRDGIYLFRCKRRFACDADAARAREELARLGDSVGCKFVLIEGPFDLLQPHPPELTIPSRGARKQVALAYDVMSDFLIVDGVRVSPGLLTSLITNPDPNMWIACERNGDAVTCRQQAARQIVGA